MKLRLLHLEDNTDDVELLRLKLSEEWPECQTLVVAKQADFQQAIEQGEFDLILADYRIPGFGGLAALALARQHCPEIPFIFISGVMGEDFAVEALKMGAADYVVKDRLARLVPAIRRALKEAEERAGRRQAEEQVQRIQTELEQTNRDLLRKNQEIQNFYHTLSHELKTPLTSAREFISIVSDGLAGPLNSTQVEYLGIARQSCDQLRVCINDLLDATRLETGKLAIELKPTSLTVLIRRVVTVVTPAATDKKIGLTAEVQSDLPQLPFDEHRMTQVITNLLNNAIKFTPPGGKIVIKAGDAPGRPELVEVSVSDTGCGIPREEQSRIFDRLYQVKAGDGTSEQGVGLGLYLCRELVQLHGGEISVESQPGQGSTFSFAIPRSEHMLRANLLVIDDDPQMREMLQELLERDGYNVHAAAGGSEALDWMRRQTPDVVLLDLSMPELDGPATLKEIRNGWGSVPVIVYTGYAESDLVKRALAFSPFTLLAKPCPAAQLLETVRKVQRAGDTTTWKKNHFGLLKPRVKRPRRSDVRTRRSIKLR
jgi:signal transduction histidine kinase